MQISQAPPSETAAAGRGEKVISSKDDKVQTTYIYLHLLVRPIVHDQAVGQPYAMRLHGMAGDICIVSDIRIIEVRDLLLRPPSIGGGRVDWSEARHGPTILRPVV